MSAHTFTNPDIQQKATLLARIAKRPTQYMSKNRRIEAVKREIIKEELIKQGYLRMVRDQLPAIIAAHIEVAQVASPRATPERKLLFEAAGLLNEKNGHETAGNMLGQLFASVQKRGVTTIDPYEYE